MKFLILSLLVASALSAPQGGKQEFQQQVLQSQAPLQLILIPGGAAQSTYSTSSVQGQQAIPAGAQIVYLQPAGVQNSVGQSQVAYIQSASQGQGGFIQGAAPQGQIAYILSGAPQGQFGVSQSVAPAPQGQFGVSKSVAPAPQGQFGVSQSVAPAPQAQFQGQFNNLQTQKSVSSQTYQPASSSLLGSGSYKKTQTKSQTFKPAPSTGFNPAPAPVVAKSKSKYQGSPSPVSPGTPGQGGLVGYVIIKQSQDDNFDGNFQYDFETDHGIVVNALGSLKNAGSEDEIQVISGSYSYKTPDGVVITTTYTADENGFVAQGDHLPVAPELPEAIAKSIAYARSLPPSDENL